MLSVFNSFPNTTNSSGITANSASITNGTYVYTTTNITTTNTTFIDEFLVFLVNSVGNPLTSFPSCIYPDLAGAYTIQLRLTDQCQSVTNSIVVTAACDGAPTISVTVAESNGEDSFVSMNASSAPDHPIYNIALARDRPRRVVLDASSTVGYTNSRLTFYWAWAATANTPTAQDGIDEPYGPEASLEIVAGGVYDLIVTVHDGCAVSTLPVTLVASCGALNLDVATSQTLTVNNGGNNPTSLQTFFIEEASQHDCAYSNQWTYYNFTTGTSSAGETARPLFFISFFFSLILALS